ncbi:YfiR family protein [Marinobacter sp. F3R08]|uniref:YfiR family protein n=1 Tax=Marinobacter sp. F3R08 TaxID=2841559 RepID=UPI001C098F8B|nr:YfiR family protein [Marinobacter sp. F3R08]MBU2955800.1 YfiR family protein [Marinobacter sp. F3R08]
MKAAFLYNFTRLVTWPNLGKTASPLEICVYGADPFGGLLDPIRGRQSQGRNLTLRYSDVTSDLSGCDVLYIDQSLTRGLQSLLDLANERNILTVSDLPDFARKGGMIGYVKQGNVIRFEINLKAADEAGLIINSRLLELAVEVMR